MNNYELTKQVLGIKHTNGVRVKKMMDRIHYLDEIGQLPECIMNCDRCEEKYGKGCTEDDLECLRRYTEWFNEESTNNKVDN